MTERAPSDLTAARLRREVARLSASEPSLIGSALARVREQTGLTSPELAQTLSLSVAHLEQLAMCRRPRPDHFADDVTAIANRFAIDRASLVALLEADAEHVTYAPAAASRISRTRAAEPSARYDDPEESK